MRRLALRAAAVALVLGALLAANAGYENLQSYWQIVIIQCGIFVVLAVSLNLVNGFTGQFSIGHAGFMAVGAYAGGAVSYLIWTPFKAAAEHAHPGLSSARLLAL